MPDAGFFFLQRPQQRKYIALLSLLVFQWHIRQVHSYDDIALLRFHIPDPAPRRKMAISHQYIVWLNAKVRERLSLMNVSDMGFIAAQRGCIDCIMQPP